MVRGVDGVVPLDGVAPADRLTPFEGELGTSVVDVVVGGVVVEESELIDVVMASVATGTSDGAGACAAGSTLPGFCQTDRVVVSPTSGKSTSRNASADPDVAITTTTDSNVPARRRVLREKRRWGDISAGAGTGAAR